MSTVTAVVLIISHAVVALALIIRCCNTNSRPQSADRETRER